MLTSVVKNTPCDANSVSPPKRFVKIDVLDADGIAACNKIIAFEIGESPLKKKIMQSAIAGIKIRRHNTKIDIAL